MDQLQHYISLINNADQNTLEELRITLLGKNGIITNKLKELSTLSFEEKKTAGAELNNIKNTIAESIANRKKTLHSPKQKNTIDYTIPERINLGQPHLISEQIARLKNIFAIEGFSFANGPDIEDVYYNFEALNIPKAHPARDNNDTFYLNETKILRTHTTCVQIRLLEQLKNQQKSDIRSYSIGRVFRNDEHDATHSCSFHQIEGIVIEKNASLPTLKGFIETLIEQFLEKKIEVILRPSYFPFTTPSCEAYINMNGKLLEIGGCGIIHPNILKNFSQTECGFAFGLGLERLIMIKYGMSSLHDMYNNHVPTLLSYSS